MKHLLLCLLFVPVMAHRAQAQNKLYLNLNSHNEMVGENYDTDSLLFDSSTTYLHQIAQAVVTKNAKYDYQTNSKYVLAVIKYQHGDTSSSDILEWMSHTGHIQVDPRPKTQLPFYTYNISDVVYLLDSVGVPDSRTVGGFIYYPYSSQDWTPYNSTITGTHYGNAWNAEILWGAGSTPPHSHDAHNFGIWKPSGATDSVSFFTHSATGAVWVEGNGCSAVLYDTTDPADVFAVIKDAADKVSGGYWPSDRFYSMSVMFNQRDLSAAFALKVEQLLDSINTLVAANKVVWTTIREKFDTFQAWSTTTGHAYSQWACDQEPSAVNDVTAPGVSIYPNPSAGILMVDNAPGCSYTILGISGATLQQGRLGTGHETISVAQLPPGMYIFCLNDGTGSRRMKFLRE